MMKHMPVLTPTGTVTATNQQNNVVIKKVRRSPSANNCFGMRFSEWAKCSADAFDIKS